MTGRRVLVRPRIWILLIGLIVTLVATRAWRESRPKPTTTARQIRQELLSELQPIALKNCTLQRFGGPNDGGYLMCGNLLGNIRSAYSYGIGTDDNWGCQVSTQFRVPVHEYDCFNPAQPACPSGRPLFHDECIGPRTETVEKRLFDTLANQVEKNGDGGKLLVVKIDVEGAEVDSLLSTPEEVLDRIDQLAMEVHGTDRRYLHLIRRLKRVFHVVHLHFNNQACAARFDPFPAWAYQVLLVNRRIGVPDPSAPKPVLPHPLDAPDYLQGHDCQTIGTMQP